MLTQLPPVPPARGLGGLGWLGGAVVSPGETEAGHRNGLGALPVAVKAIRIANPSLDPVLEKRRLPEVLGLLTGPARPRTSQRTTGTLGVR